MTEAQHEPRRDEPTEAEPSDRGRTRTCVGCGERVAVDDPGAMLVRLVLGADGEVAVDAKGGSFGRGAHVHVAPTCLQRAAKHGLAKSFKGAATSITAAELASQIAAAMERRIDGLLASAVRAGALAIGADAVTGACVRGEAALVLVTCDAAAAANLTEVRRAVSEGRAVAWSTKARLGAFLGKGSDVAVVAITSQSARAGASRSLGKSASAAFTNSIREAVHAVDACRAREQIKTARGGSSNKEDAERGA